VARLEHSSDAVNPRNSSSGNAAPLVANDTRWLAQALSRWARSDGDHETPVAGLTLHRRHKLTMPLHCIYGLGIGLTVQGRKQVIVGDELMTYSPGQSMVTSIDMPVISNVIQASVAQPFLGMMLTFENALVVEIAERLQLSQRLKDEAFKPLSVNELDSGVLEALERLIALFDQPELLKSLAPLIKEEIIIRLMNGAHGPHILHVVSAGSPSQNIAKAVAWLKLHYTQALRMDDLAATAHMSPSTFRQHFRTVTGMSPLQYQKQLRLQAARHLMYSENIDASSAGGLVGYESSSQFSREYSRLFGHPPQRDIKRMRVQ